MITVYTKPRRVTVDYAREGDEIAAWKGGDLCGGWRDHYEDRTEWLPVDQIKPADPENPLGLQVVTFLGGDQRKVDRDDFIVIREPVVVPEELVCDCG